MTPGLRLPALLACLATAGCARLPMVPPSLPGGALIPGTEDCRHVVASDRGIWWTRNQARELARIDPRSRTVVATNRIPAEYAGFDLAAGFGAIWLSEGGAHPSIHRFDARTGRPTSRTRLDSLWGSKGKRTHLAVGEGAVWATVNVLKTVFRLDAETGAIVARIPLGPIPLSDGPGRLAAGEGAVWVLHHATVTRVDPATNRIATRIPLPGLVAGIGTVAIGGGAVWVAAGSTVNRIDPKTNRIVATIGTVLDPDSPPNLYGVADLVIANDALWALVVRFSGAFADQTHGSFALVEIDMRTNAIRAIRQLGAGDAMGVFGGPTLAVADGVAWICLPAGLYMLPLAPAGPP